MSNKKIDLKLDWLSFTYKPDKSSFISLFGKENADMFVRDLEMFFMEFPEFNAIKDDFLVLSGRSRYQNIIGFLGVSDTCRISYNEPGFCSVDMGVNVSIPSHGLEWFFNLFNIDIERDDAVQKMFKLLQDRNCNISRIDLAFDDYAKTFRPGKYALWYINDMIKTRFLKIKTVCSQHNIGHTFYIGSRKTGRMLRIYDKDFESKGAVDSVRYEFELHGKYAKDMFIYLINNKTLDFVSYLRSYIEVVDLRNNTTNKSQCPLLSEWENWLAELDFCE